MSSLETIFGKSNVKNLDLAVKNKGSLPFKFDPFGPPYAPQSA